MLYNLDDYRKPSYGALLEKNETYYFRKIRTKKFTILIRKELNSTCFEAALYLTSNKKAPICEVYSAKISPKQAVNFLVFKFRRLHSQIKNLEFEEKSYPKKRCAWKNFEIKRK